MGWDLFGWSFSVIRKHKQLIWFPIFSGGAGLAAVILWFLLHPQSLLWLLPGYFALSFVIVFFNCALASCAQAYFAGQEVSIGYGLRRAASRFGAHFRMGGAFHYRGLSAERHRRPRVVGR